MGRKEKAINNATFSMINIIITKICPFFLRTLLLNVLGTKYLGINNFFHSIISILSMADLGFGSALSYELYKPIAENDEKKVSEIYALYRKIYRIVGLLILCVGLLLIPFLDYLINDTYPDGVNISLIYTIYLLETVCYYLFYTEDQALLAALQRSDIQNKIYSIINICVYSLRAILLIAFKNYYLFILFLPIGAMINRFVLHIFTHKKYPQFHQKVENSNTVFLSIKSNTINVTEQRIFTTISSSISSIFISRFLGLNMVTVYSNYTYVSTSLSSIMSSVVTSVTPSIGNSIVLNDRDKNKTFFDVVTIICLWISTWSTTCLYNLYQRFMIIWMGQDLLLDTLSVLLFCVSYYLSTTCLSLNVITSANGMWAKEKWRVIVSSTVSVALQYILVKKYNVIGIIFAGVISTVFIGYPWLTKYVFNDYFKQKTLGYYLELFKNTVVTFLSILVSNYVCNYVVNSGIFGLFLCGIISFMISNVFFVFFFIKNKNFYYLINIVGHYINKSLIFLRDRIINHKK